MLALEADSITNSGGGKDYSTMFLLQFHMNAFPLKQQNTFIFLKEKFLILVNLGCFFKNDKTMFYDIWILDMQGDDFADKNNRQISAITFPEYTLGLYSFVHYTDAVNPDTGGDTGITMQYQFDVLGSQGVLCGTEFNEYSAYNDSPEEPFAWGQFLKNLAIGAGVTILFGTAAVLTGGLLAAVMLGAAVGSGVATTVISVSDFTSKEVRSTKDALKTIGGGALFGAVIGGSIYLLPPSINGASAALTEMAASLESATLTIPNIFGGMGLVGSNAAALAAEGTPIVVNGLQIAKGLGILSAIPTGIMFSKMENGSGGGGGAEIRRLITSKK